MSSITIGWALCGSFCTFRTAVDAMADAVKRGCCVLPIMSYNAARLDTRFGRAQDFKNEIKLICGAEIVESIAGAEPIGPQSMCDVLLVAPCTGNTLAKLAHGIADTPVTMAVKSHLRGQKPVVVALSSNDAMSAGFVNLALLMNRKNYYFVPMRADSPESKPASLVADYSLVLDSVNAALRGQQLLPLIR